MKMNEFEKFVKEMGKSPTVYGNILWTESNVLVDKESKHLNAQTINVKRNTQTEAENALMLECEKLMQGNEVWIRVMPHVHKVVGGDAFIGNARIAVTPKEVSTPFINIDERGQIIKDDMYNGYIEGRDKRNKETELERTAKEETESKRRASLTPKERIKEDIESYLRDVSYGGEYDFETLEKLYREYIKSP